MRVETLHLECHITVTQSMRKTPIFEIEHNKWVQSPFRLHSGSSNGKDPSLSVATIGNTNAVPKIHSRDERIFCLVETSDALLRQVCVRVDVKAWWVSRCESQREGGITL